MWQQMQTHAHKNDQLVKFTMYASSMRSWDLGEVHKVTIHTELRTNLHKAFKQSGHCTHLHRHFQQYARAQLHMESKGQCEKIGVQFHQVIVYWHIAGFWKITIRNWRVAQLRCETSNWQTVSSTYTSNCPSVNWSVDQKFFYIANTFCSSPVNPILCSKRSSSTVIILLGSKYRYSLVTAGFGTRQWYIVSGN